MTSQVVQGTWIRSSRTAQVWMGGFEWRPATRGGWVGVQTGWVLKGTTRPPVEWESLNHIFLITLFLCVSSWLRTKLLFTFLKKPVCSSRVSEVHTSVKSDGEPCGRLLYNDLRAITSSMEKAFNSRLDMKSGPRQYISAPRWNLCLKLTSNAVGMIHQSAKDEGSFVTNSKDITMFVAVSVSGLS